MRTKMFVMVTAIFLFALSLYAPMEASAVPAFARQTGMACNTCHYQHFPNLNSFGRAFKAGGYTMVGGQSLIEGDFLSLPSTLNASLITKIRFQKTNGDIDSSGTNKGELQFPDEAALLIGGRAGEHVGFLLEYSIKEGDPGFTSFKMPFTYTIGNDTKLAVIPFTTDAAGAAYGYELLNTGALRINRPIEHRQQISAQQFLGTDGSATGIAFVVHRELYHANYTMWSNNHGDTDAGPYLSYARLAFTPTVAGWDLGAGVQWWGGSGKRASAYTKADAWAIDAQAQGMVASFPVGVYASYGKAGKSDAGEAANIFNPNTTDDTDAFGILVEFGVIPNRLTLDLGYLTGNAAAHADARAGMNGNKATGSQSAVTIGANYQLTQNVNLVWNSSFHSGDTFDTNANGDQLHTAQIFAAF